MQQWFLLVFSLGIMCASNLNQLASLHTASRNGLLNVLTYRLNNNEDIEARDATGATPLIIAAIWSQTKAVALLLERGANVNACDNKAYAALHYATAGSAMSIIKLLLKYKADINAQSAHLNVLDEALYQNNVSVIKLLLNYLPKINKPAYVNHSSPEKVLPLLLYGERFIAASGMVPTRFFCKLSEGNTPLIFETALGNKDEVVQLLSQGAAVFVKNNDGRNVFWYLDRILHRTDLSEERREDYKKIMTLLCKYAWYRQEACKNLKLPQDMQKYIKSLC